MSFADKAVFFSGSLIDNMVFSTLCCKQIQKFMRRLFLLLMLLVVTSLSAQDRYYMEKARSYMREAEYYNKKAQGYLREADYYSRNKKHDKANTYTK